MGNRNKLAAARSKRDPGTFLALPMEVLNCNAFLGLSGKAVKLLLDLGSQYRFDNNGDLCAAWKVMKRRGRVSEHTLHRAKQELQKSRLIVETRMGARPNKCSLCALTFYSLDHCGGKLEMSQRAFPRGAWKDPLPIGSMKPTNWTPANGAWLATETAEPEAA